MSPNPPEACGNNRKDWATSYSGLLKVGSGIAITAFVIGWWYETYTSNRRLLIENQALRRAKITRDALDERPGGVYTIHFRGVDPTEDKRREMKVTLNDD